jgi:valyl-tRNA synthetase
MSLTSMNAHGIDALRLTAAWRQNGRSLSFKMERQESPVEFTIFVTSDEEFDRLRFTIPRASDFVETDKPTSEV